MQNVKWSYIQGLGIISGDNGGNIKQGSNLSAEDCDRFERLSKREGGVRDLIFRSI